MQASGESSSKGKTGKIREAYIRAAMSYLNKAVQMLDTEKQVSTQRINRCLVLLKSVLEG